MSVIHRQLQTFLAIDALLTQLINGQDVDALTIATVVRKMEESDGQH
jgi:hypothetical protein